MAERLIAAQQGYLNRSRASYASAGSCPASSGLSCKNCSGSHGPVLTYAISVGEGPSPAVMSLTGALYDRRTGAITRPGAPVCRSESAVEGPPTCTTGAMVYGRPALMDAAWT
jgi:hypothetical protein